jgi:hypothetical protein
VTYAYRYKDHSIAIDLWFHLAASGKKCWNAEALVIDPPPYSASKKINLRRLFDSSDQADNHARAFIEKWIDDGKPSIDPGELD